MMKKEEVLNLLNIIKMPYCILNQYGVFVEVNEEYCKLYRYNPSDLIGYHFTKLFDEECKENIEANKIFDKEESNKRFLNSFGKHKGFFVHPISYREKDREGNDFDIQTISYDFKDIDNKRYRLAIDYKFSKRIEIEKVEDVFTKNTYNILPFDFLEREVDKYLVHTKNPKFTLFNIKLVNLVIPKEIKKELFRNIYTNLLKIFGEDSIISYKSSNRFIVFSKSTIDETFIIEKSRRVLNFFDNPIKISNNHIKENVKIGITTFKDRKNIDFNELYTETELAIKFSSKGAYSIYSNEVKEKSNKEIEIASIIFKAYKSNEFTAYYQPYYSLKEDKIIGMEALMRIESQKKEIIYPGEFIELLEKNSFILKVEEKLIEKIIVNIKKWSKVIKKVPRVAINISSLQFKNINFLEFLKKTLEKNKVDPENITLEITESMLMEDIELSSYMLVELKKIGISISVDDFGTGYSSLAYLKTFPIDNLKIDMSFIRNIHLNSDNRAIVGAIIVMAKKLGLKTICEGVELKEELEVLKNLGADIVQGYIFARPTSEEKILDIIKDRVM